MTMFRKLGVKKDLKIMKNRVEDLFKTVEKK
jgi:hypothetical protein